MENCTEALSLGIQRNLQTWELISAEWWMRTIAAFMWGHLAGKDYTCGLWWYWQSWITNILNQSLLRRKWFILTSDQEEHNSRPSSPIDMVSGTCQLRQSMCRVRPPSKPGAERKTRLHLTCTTIFLLRERTVWGHAPSQPSGSSIDSPCRGHNQTKLPCYSILFL